jgi:hypothetical protein
MKRLAALVLLASLCGCVTRPQGPQLTVDQADDIKCQGYGVAKGSAAYVQCRMNLNDQRAANERADTAARAAILGAYMMSH